MQLQSESNTGNLDHAVVSFPPLRESARKLPSQHSCMACTHKSSCLAQELRSDEIDYFNTAVIHSHRLNSGEHLYRMWDPVRSVFTVLSGSIKIYRLSENGSEDIIGFYQPGELVAIDAIGIDTHPSSAVALEPSSVCEIPISLFSKQSEQMPHLQYGLIRQLSNQLRNEERHSVLRGQKSAEQRLAMFLVNVSKRLKRNAYRYDEFHLSMSRSDIGNYLGLAMETVSRTFTRFQNLTLITVHRKQITIHNMDGLESLTLGNDEFKKDELSVQFGHTIPRPVQPIGASIAI